MTPSFFQVFYPSSSKRSARFLAFSFLLGLTCGIVACLQMDVQLFSLMRGIIADSVSIVCLIVSLLIPLLVSLSAFFVDPVLLFPICFARAFLFAFVHMCLLGCFGAQGWLIRWLLLFSDIISLPVFYFYWHRRLASNAVNFGSFLFAAAALCIIGSFDYYAVSPFRTGLLILQKG